MKYLLSKCMDGTGEADSSCWKSPLVWGLWGLTSSPSGGQLGLRGWRPGGWEAPQMPCAGAARTYRPSGDQSD